MSQRGYEAYLAWARRRAQKAFQDAMWEAITAGMNFDECMIALAEAWEYCKGFAAWQDEEEET